MLGIPLHSISWCSNSAAPGNQETSNMSKNRLHYIDLRPAPLQREPSTLAIWAGAAAFVVVTYAVTFVLFAL